MSAAFGIQDAVAIALALAAVGWLTRRWWKKLQEAAA